MWKKETWSVEILKTINPLSKQAKENTRLVWTRPPVVPFKSWISLYYNSFIVWGLTDKVWTAINSWFESTDQELLRVINNIDHEFLNRNKVLCWNAFFEVIRNWAGKVVELLPIISDTILIMEDWDGFQQKIWTDTVYFNTFTPVDQRKEKIKIWEESKAKSNELVNTWKGCGFNPNLNEVYQFKNTSLSTKYYWESFFESVVEQVSLVEQIDKFYSKGFDNGMIKAKLLFPTWEKQKFSTNDKAVLKQFISSKMKGLDKSFSTAILDFPVWQMDLEHEIDANAFIWYRKELLKSVSIALNVPFDLLLSDNSNRASSQVSVESFNQYTVWPFQQQNIKDFKYIFSEWYKTDDLNYLWIDTKDEKEQMEVLTWYKKFWIMTPNEVRKKLWLSPIDGWDELKSENNSEIKSQIDDILKKEVSNTYSDLTKIEYDLYKNL